MLVTLLLRQVITDSKAHFSYGLCTNAASFGGRYLTITRSSSICRVEIVDVDFIIIEHHQC